MTRIYLAYSSPISFRATFPEGFDFDECPIDLLVSFVFLPKYRKLPWVKPRRTMLDSGAFSAWNSGKRIDIDALIEETRSGRWDESVALDVIGDAEGSLKNALYMQARGSPAFPVFHIGDPWEILDEYTYRFSRVGLSCRFGEPERESLAFYDRCFARAWPHRFHSFGWIKDDVLRRYPFDTADSSSWATNPEAFGGWWRTESDVFGATRTKVKLSVRGTKNLRGQVERVNKFSRFLAYRWAKELDLCRSLPCRSERGRSGDLAVE